MKFTALCKDFHKNANQIRESFTSLAYPWGFNGYNGKYPVCKHTEKRRKQLIARANRDMRNYW